MTTTTRVELAVAVTLLASTVWLANYLTANLDPTPLGWGIAVTAGTWTIAAALLIRDRVHELGGIPAVLVAIAVGGVVAYITTDHVLATASAITFVVAELADASVYTPTRRRSIPLAVALSGVVGGVVDTALFLYLARDVPFIASAMGTGLVVGQLVVKIGLSLVVAAILHYRDRELAVA